MSDHSDLLRKALEEEQRKCAHLRKENALILNRIDGYIKQQNEDLAEIFNLKALILAIFNDKELGRSTATMSRDKSEDNDEVVV